MRPQTVTDEEILSHAREVFLELGYVAPVSTIAERLGISQPALFKRFGTKQNLFIKALQPPQEISWMELVDAGPDARPFEEQFRDVAKELNAFFAELGPLIQVVKSSNIHPADFLRRGEMPLPLIALQKLSQWLERCQEQGIIRPLNPTVIATSILGAFHMQSFLSSFAMVGMAGDTASFDLEAFIAFYVSSLVID